ncbi:MAG: ATP-binding protein [Desulfosudaceae bacterium]
MTTTRKIIEIDEEKCDGCGQCVPACAEGAIQIINGKAKVINDRFCDGLGACLGECPRNALKLVEREAAEFDEAAVEEHLRQVARRDKKQNNSDTLACGCPSTRMETFARPKGTCETANQPAAVSGQRSSLGHWPVQIRLIPPGAPFLKKADLLVTADCVPVAYSSFHADFLKDKTVMIGCPKFDDMDSYLEKFTEIFKTAAVKRVTAVIMEVPCCAGLPGMLKKALARAGVDLPVNQVIISSQGEVISEMVA